MAAEQRKLLEQLMGGMFFKTLAHSPSATYSNSPDEANHQFTYS